MNWWVLNYIQAGMQVMLISHIFWLVFSITLHELAHGWAALWQGDDTPRRTGHMTASPLVHMGPESLLMLALLGIAWGAMPIDPSKFRWRRRGRILVAGAGPAMNVLLALISLTSLAAMSAFWPGDDNLHRNLGIFLWVGGWLNLTLAIFNLMPLWPLDGAQMLMGASLRWYQFYQSDRVQTVCRFIYFAIFLSGLGMLAFHLAQVASFGYVDTVLSLLGRDTGWNAAEALS